MIVDMHTHAGFGRLRGAVDGAALATMRPAGVAAAVVSAVADTPAIRRDRDTKRIVQYRSLDPGEGLRAVESHLAAYEASGMRIAREPSDIRAGDPALVLAIEGCDFLEGDLDRLDTMAARGVRSVQLTHYLVNELGDIQTEAPVHNGLTAFGRAAVQRMNQVGIVVDVAHCSEATAMGSVAATTKPILCTHANLKEPGHPNGDHPRFISLDYAKAVASTGGVVGAWIAVLWDEGLDGMIRHLFRLIDAIGIDHVGIGTDMPVGAAERDMPTFANHPKLPEAMRARGMRDDEIHKICAGNWLRVFQEVRAR